MIHPGDLFVPLTTDTSLVTRQVTYPQQLIPPDSWQPFLCISIISLDLNAPPRRDPHFFLKINKQNGKCNVTKLFVMVSLGCMAVRGRDVNEVCAH